LNAPSTAPSKAPNKAKGAPPGVASQAPESYSLFSEILDWVLVPIMVVWPVSFVLTYLIATDVAKRPHDQALANSVRVLASQVRLVNDNPVLLLPNASQAILRADDVDTVYFRVSDEMGRLIAGDAELPVTSFDIDRQDRETIYFTDDIVAGEPVRVAYLVTTLRDDDRLRDVFVQVAETLGKRNKLAGAITGLVMTILFMLIPIVIALVWFGLTRGLTPLAELKQRIQRRRANDLSPINPRETPEELASLVNTINGQMARVAAQLRVQERFVADAAHQLRTPLAGLKTQAEIALATPDAADVTARLQQIILSADNATHLVRQLLWLARADDQEAPQNFEPVLLSTLVREVALAWVDAALAKQISLAFEPPPSATWVNGDATLLRELASNLIDNAIKYTPSGGEVVVRLSVQAAAERPILLEVQDSGVGIADADRELVFERFYRVLGTGTSGSGLGLAIVRGIARRHNATATLKPGPGGQGTVAAVAFAAAGDVAPQRVSESTL
jgi:two-component system, OmpR family, sensor histidine kinase TctE